MALLLLLQVGPFAQVTFARVMVDIHTNCDNRRSRDGLANTLECCKDCKDKPAAAYKNGEAPCHASRPQPCDPMPGTPVTGGSC